MLNYNRERITEICISSVLKTEYSNFEVILVDNASSDQSIINLSKKFVNEKRLRIIQNKANLGFGPGNNVGFKHSNGEYIVFLNNDTIVEPSWLTILVNSLENDKSIGIAQSLLLEFNGKIIQSAGELVDPYFLINHSIGAGEVDSDDFPEEFDVSFVAGAAMIIGRALIDQVGLFDEKIPYYYDDTLLSLKTLLAGKRAVTISRSKVYHMGGGTTGNENFFFAYHHTRTQVLILFDLYWDLTDLVKALLVFSYYLASKLLFQLRKRNVQIFKAKILALFWCIENSRYIWKNRLELWNKSKISPRDLKLKFVRIKCSCVFVYSSTCN